MYGRVQVPRKDGIASSVLVRVHGICYVVDYRGQVYLKPPSMSWIDSTPETILAFRTQIELAL
jgi:hypothetical protein